MASEQHAAIDAAWKRYTNDDPSKSPDEQEFERFAIVFQGTTTEQRNRFAIKHINALVEAVA